MSRIHNFKIAPITNSKLFEEFIRDIWRISLNNYSLDLLECNGQNQYGIDIFGRQQDTFEFVGMTWSSKIVILSSIDF